MADSDATVRRRKPEPKSGLTPDQQQADSETERRESEAPKGKKKSSKARLEEEDDYSPWIDVLRVLSFLFFASCALSYLISSGESYFWGMKDKPNYLQPKWWKAKFAGPVYLTLDELAQYDGSVEGKPIYLAINGTIYDVSANPHTYGKGGSYNVFAGVDASRGFVTGCFGEDRTADMRGVEEMFLPLDDPAVDRQFTQAEFDALKKKELETAQQKVHDALAHWVNFFKNSKKYHFVGYVKRPAGWPGTEPKRKLCDAAQKGRKNRKLPGQQKGGK